MRFLFCLLIGLSIANPLFSQFELEPLQDQTYFIAKVGGSLTSIENLQTTIIPAYFNPSTFTPTPSKRYGFLAGIGVYHKPEDGPIGFQLDLNYEAHGVFSMDRDISVEDGDLNYSDINSYAYKVHLNYHFLNIGPSLKVFPWENVPLTLSVGAQLGVNVESNSLDFISNKTTQNKDLQVQQDFRQVLKGQNNFALNVGLSWEIDINDNSGFILECKYLHGLSDMVETQANSFEFIENKNAMKGFEVSLSYALPFYF